MQSFQDQDHWLFLVWLIVTGLTTFGVVVCWNEGLLALLYDADRSRICLVIGALYLLATVHCARRTLFITTEADEVNAIARAVGDTTTQIEVGADQALRVDGITVRRGSMLGDHLEALLNRARGEQESSQESEGSTLVGILVARAKGSHDFGWFMVDVLLKLGLLGTIVGFILMLGSVADTASLDVNTMQKVLKQMSNGMGTALYTTLAGLTGSMALGLQYLLLDKGADDLIERILRLCETRVSVS